MGNLWPYKNHHFRSKYHLVLLQESCEIIQFKSGHPVLGKRNSNINTVSDKFLKFISKKVGILSE